MEKVPQRGSLKSAEPLGFDVENLTATVHPVGGIHAVRAETSAVGRIKGDLRKAEAVCTAALAAALLGSFAFWLSHNW